MPGYNYEPPERAQIRALQQRLEQSQQNTKRLTEQIERLEQQIKADPLYSVLQS